jgi:hypothetical protein
MTCPLFVELCAGTAALSLRLHRRHARPPVSRMGAKTGYADAILRVLGLRPGQGAAHYLWCEPDPGVRLLLEAYRDADLARAAAATIRGWADEEPRALWERLRAEGPPRGVEAGEVARWARLTTANRLIPATWVDGQWRNTGDGGSTFGGDEFCTPAVDLAAKFEASVGDMPATVEADARRVDPREVARWAWVNRRAWKGDPEHGYMDAWAAKPVADPARQGHRWTPEQPAPLFEVLPVMPATITPDARAIEPGPDLPPGTVAYMDPPYVNTTGYGHDLPRSEVVALARRWSAAGAMVAISEAEPIGDLVAEGWHAVRIDGERMGQKRTFSKQQAEWLTLSRPPAWTPSEQRGLFG